MRQLTYDPACEVLAKHFLPANAAPTDAPALASVIQQAIEDWLDYRSEQIRDRVESSARDQS